MNISVNSPIRKLDRIGMAVSQRTKVTEGHGVSKFTREDREKTAPHGDMAGDTRKAQQTASRGGGGRVEWL